MINRGFVGDARRCEVPSALISGRATWSVAGWLVGGCVRKCIISERSREEVCLADTACVWLPRRVDHRARLLRVLPTLGSIALSLRASVPRITNTTPKEDGIVQRNSTENCRRSAETPRIRRSDVFAEDPLAACGTSENDVTTDVFVYIRHLSWWLNKIKWQHSDSGEEWALLTWPGASHAGGNTEQEKKRVHLRQRLLRWW